MQNELQKGTNSGWLRDDGIVVLVCGNDHNHEGTFYRKRDALDARDLYASLGALNERNFVLCDITKLKRVDLRARIIDPSPDITRIALLIKSPVSKMIGNLYLTSHRGMCATRLFAHEHEAISWLKAGMTTA